jgi:hypothetical protein
MSDSFSGRRRAGAIRRNGKDVSLEADTEFDSFSGRFGNLFG